MSSSDQIYVQERSGMQRSTTASITGSIMLSSTYATLQSSSRIKIYYQFINKDILATACGTIVYKIIKVPPSTSLFGSISISDSYTSEFTLPYLLKSSYTGTGT